jgi:hypothetical protein
MDGQVAQQDGQMDRRAARQDGQTRWESGMNQTGKMRKRWTTDGGDRGRFFFLFLLFAYFFLFIYLIFHSCFTYHYFS